MDDTQEMIAEFITDCSENLEEFENNLLDLERDPEASTVLDSMFRQIHSIKGASGFMTFTNLESLTHKAENVLDLLRQEKGCIDQSLISTFLDVCDAMKSMFTTIQEEGNDGNNTYADLVNKLLKYEDSFKNNKPIDLDEVTNNEAGEDTETQEEELELDPVQIEALKSLGMYNEEDVKEKAPSAVEPEHKEKIEEKAAKQSAPIQKKETIRVEVDTLDRLMNLAGELVLVRNQLLEIAKTNESKAFEQSFSNLDIVTGEIQRSLMVTRMQPISVVWSKMPRIVRDLSAQLGRDIQLLMQGENTELDKAIIETISDPMTHIIRNCCDHGIEMPNEREAKGKPKRGTIKLIAEHRSNWIHVDVIDDGKGISRDVLRQKAIEKGLYTQEELAQMDDQQTLNIIFHPGFSTKDQASNISGRGVGMDVIRSNITKINGAVELSSIEGEGTHLKIKLPLTLAIIPAVIVSINKDRYAIPQNTVQEVAFVSKEDIEQLDNIGGQKFTRLRGKILPLIFASEFLGTKQKPSPDNDELTLNYIVINADGYSYGLVIDEVIDIIEIVVKPLDSSDDFSYYAGATIMGDGRVALILDANKIAEFSSIDQTSTEEELHDIIKDSTSSSDLTLLFKLRDGNNYLIPLSKTSRIEEIPKVNIEKRQLGCFAKFNNRVIRIIDLVSLLGINIDSKYDKLDDDESIKALYFEFNGHGIAIDVGFNHLLLQGGYEVELTHSSEFVVGTSLIGDDVFEVLNLEDYLAKVTGDLAASSISDSLDNDGPDGSGLLDLSQTNSIISFDLANLQFGIDLEAVSEIITSEEITATPGSRESVDGLLNLRGEIMVSRNLHSILNFNPEELTKDSSEELENRSLILHDSKNNKMCLQIGRVNEILNLKKDDFNTAPTNIPGNVLNYLKGVYKRQGSMLLLLDEQKMITEITSGSQLGTVH